MSYGGSSEGAGGGRKRSFSTFSAPLMPGLRHAPTVSSSTSPRRPRLSTSTPKLEEDLNDLPLPGRAMPTPPSSGVSQDEAPEPQIVLDEYQQEAIHVIFNKKHNTFITAQAGGGKSTVIGAIITEAHRRRMRVAVAAPTGPAAFNVKGCTFHSLFGLVPDDFKNKNGLRHFKSKGNNKRIKDRLEALDMLVMDEASMISSEFFERLNCISKQAKNSQEPFGGMRIVMSGDFYQLPPVQPFEYCIDCGRKRRVEQGGTVYSCEEHGEVYDKDQWAFKAAAWKEAEFKCVYLRQVHRQTDDVLMDILHKMWSGIQLNDTEFGLLKRHPHIVDDSAVKLFPTKAQVDRLNQAKFRSLPGKSYTYTCLDEFYWKQDVHPWLGSWRDRSVDGTLKKLNHHRYTPFLQLKRHMPVVLLINLDVEKGLVNGSQGEVVGFQSYNAANMPKPRSRTDSSQTAMEDEDGQGDAVYVPPMGGSHMIMRQEKIKEFIHKEENQDKVWPVVKFKNGRQVLIFASCDVNAVGWEEPYSYLSRTQIPLVAGWALTIHKAQGMTLDRVEVDLSHRFERGQVYVALSRVRRLEHMLIHGLGQDLGGRDSEVADFYKNECGIHDDFTDEENEELYE